MREKKRNTETEKKKASDPRLVSLDLTVRRKEEASP